MSGEKEVWKRGDCVRHFESLPKNRRPLVRGYMEAYIVANDAIRKQRRIGRKLTDHEERIGAALALEEISS